MAKLTEKHVWIKFLIDLNTYLQTSQVVNDAYRW